MKLSIYIGIIATVISGQPTSKLKCDVSTIFNVHCSVTNGMTIETVSATNEGLSSDCKALLTTANEFEIRSSGSGIVPATNDCLLDDLAAEKSYDPLVNAEAKCWSKSDAHAELLQISTDVFLFDKVSDIRPWTQVTLQCDLLKAVTVTPLSISVAESELDDVGTTADPVSLSIKALIDNTDTALAPPDTRSLTLGTTAYFFVETTLSAHFDLVLGTCTYMGDPVTDASDYVMGMSNKITTNYKFASDVVGFTMQIYQNSKSNDIVECDVTIGFASDIVIPVSPDAGQITTGNMLATGITLYHEWTLSVDLKLPLNEIAFWSNLLVLQGDSADGTTVGHRIPAVFMAGTDWEPGINKINVSNHVNGYWASGADFVVSSTDWFNLTIQQRLVSTTIMWEIKIDGELKYSTANNEPHVWNNVKVFIAGETFTGPVGRNPNVYESTVGEYKNFSLKTIKQ